MNDGSTHWEGCWKDHPDCALARVEISGALIRIRNTEPISDRLLEKCIEEHREKWNRDIENWLKKQVGDE